MSEQPAGASGSFVSERFDLSDAESLDAVFDVLSDDRRRHALHCLHEFDDPLPLADLADEVTVRENGVPITETSAEEVKRVYVSLYHTHVPKLEDAGFVTYDQERDLVALASERTSPDAFTEAPRN